MKKYIVVGLLVLLIVGLTPYNTTVVPNWKLRVLTLGLIEQDVI